MQEIFSAETGEKKDGGKNKKKTKYMILLWHLIFWQLQNCHFYPLRLLDSFVFKEGSFFFFFA